MCYQQGFRRYGKTIKANKCSSIYPKYVKKIHQLLYVVEDEHSYVRTYLNALEDELESN